MLAVARGRPCRLISVPTGLLHVGATLVGKKALAQRLPGSLQADITKTRELLDWEPPYTVDQGLRRCFETHMPERAAVIRLFDVLFSAVGLILGAPLLLLLSSASSIPAHPFRQVRVGRDQKPLRCGNFEQCGGIPPRSLLISRAGPQSPDSVISFAEPSLMNCRNCGTCSKAR